MTARGWDVRSLHLFRTFQDEDEMTENVRARLLVQTTVGGKAEESLFRYKIQGGLLNCHFWAVDICDKRSLKPFQLRLETRGGEIDFRTHGLINYIETKAKGCHLKKFTCKGTLTQVFIRVYRPQTNKHLPQSPFTGKFFR